MDRCAGDSLASIFAAMKSNGTRLLVGRRKEKKSVAIAKPSDADIVVKTGPDRWSDWKTGNTALPLFKSVSVF